MGTTSAGLLDAYVRGHALSLQTKACMNSIRSLEESNPKFITLITSVPHLRHVRPIHARTPWWHGLWSQSSSDSTRPRKT
jgi:hypothetical protein